MTWSLWRRHNAGSGALERWKKSFKGLKEDEFIESILSGKPGDGKGVRLAATYRLLYDLK
jgi:hypothetical protein